MGDVGTDDDDDDALARMAESQGVCWGRLVEGRDQGAQRLYKCQHVVCSGVEASSRKYFERHVAREHPDLRPYVGKAGGLLKTFLPEDWNARKAEKKRARHRRYLERRKEVSLSFCQNDKLGLSVRFCEAVDPDPI
jgi:hypothetical protein